MFTFGATSIDTNIKTNGPTFQFGTAMTTGTNAATAAATTTESKSAPIDTLYSHLDMSMINECIGMELPTYLIRQRAKTMRENIKRQSIKDLMTLFSSYTTNSVNLAPWEQLPEPIQQHKATRHFHQLVELQKDVWTGSTPATLSANEYVISSALFESKFKRYTYSYTGSHHVFYTSMAVFHQSSIVELLEKYNKAIDSYKEQIENLNKWESECLAICNGNANSEQLVSIDLNECFNTLLDKVIPVPENEVVKKKATSVHHKLEVVHSKLHEEKLNRDNYVGTLEESQWQKRHADNNDNAKHLPMDNLTTPPNEKISVAIDRTLNQSHDSQMRVKYVTLSSTIGKKKYADSKPSNSNLVSKNQSQNAVFVFNDPSLDVEAVYLDRPTNTELLQLIGCNVQKFGKSSYLAMCLKTLYYNVECKATSMPTRYQIMIAHLALRILNFSGSVYVDKYRKSINANNIWESTADYSKLNAGTVSTIEWVKANTPSLFLTDASVQAKFHELFSK
jgi:hypothetical protein